MKRTLFALCAFISLLSLYSCASAEPQPEVQLIEEADATSAATDATSGATSYSE